MSKRSAPTSWLVASRCRPRDEPRTTGHRPQTTGHGPQATDHRPQATGHRTQATGHGPQATGHGHRPRPQARGNWWVRRGVFKGWGTRLCRGVATPFRISSRAFPSSGASMASASRTMILALAGVLATLLAGAQGKSELRGRVVSEARGTAAVTLPRRARLSQEFTLISEATVLRFCRRACAANYGCRHGDLSSGSRGTDGVSAVQRILRSRAYPVQVRL